MKTPKILPWIGRRAGLSEQLTLKLWRRASGESAKRCGSWKNAAYFSGAMARFIDLVEDESVGGRSMHPMHPMHSMGSLDLMRAYQEQVSVLSSLAMESSAHLWQLYWDVFVALRVRRK
ncbi:MAG: hypothetical protein ACTS5I_08700 [Rhodanobacter sp.]